MYEDFRQKIIDSSLSKQEKRELLHKYNESALSEEEKEKVLSHKKNQQNVPVTFWQNTRYFLATHKILFGLILVFLLLWSWNWYTHPANIKVRGFIWAVWKVRTSLHTLKKHEPSLYKLVKNNIDEINIDYVANPANKGGHAFMKEWVQIVRIFRPSYLETPYLSQLLVHEACHGHQWEYMRFGKEPQQKLESECQYLWIYTIESMFPQEEHLLQILYGEATDTNGTWWNGWKHDWTDGDTTQGLSELLPKEKIQEYKYFWENYEYDL